jgi:hypothetical protein
MRKAAAAAAPHGAEPPLAGAARLSARRSSVRVSECLLCRARVTRVQLRPSLPSPRDSHSHAGGNWRADEQKGRLQVTKQS